MSSLSTRFTLACPLLTREADPRAVDREMQQARRALGEQDSEKGSAASAGSSGAGGSDAGGVMTVTDFERIIEATLNQLLSDLSDSDEVPLRQLMRALPPRAALAGQEAVETALDSMEKANKVMPVSYTHLTLPTILRV